jgi:hypothetical protein
MDWQRWLLAPEQVLVIFLANLRLHEDSFMRNDQI